VQTSITILSSQKRAGKDIDVNNYSVISQIVFTESAILSYHVLRIITLRFNQMDGSSFSFGSVRGTFVHILSAESIWRMRCQEGVSPEKMIGESIFPDLEPLQVGLAEEKTKMMCWGSIRSRFGHGGNSRSSACRIFMSD
jgi:hypothetical protein